MNRTAKYKKLRDKLTWERVQLRHDLKEYHTILDEKDDTEPKKAILIVDIPHYAEVDDVKIKYELFIGDKQIYGDYNFNNLMPIPRKDKGKHWHNSISKANTYVCGWNDCIDEILGERNENTNSSN